MSVLALIPARGGSRGLAGKNLAMVAGKPLLSWTVEAAQRAAGIDRVVVSSDDPAILVFAEELGCEALRRPAPLATDDARSEGVVQHALEVLGEVFEVVVLLQPTSPLRNARHIDAALARMSLGLNAVISVVTLAKSPFKAFFVNGSGCLEPVAADAEAPFKPRQSLPDAYLPNGAIYAVRVPTFLKHGSFLPPGTVPYVMDPADSTDVDSARDLLEVDRCLRIRLELPEGETQSGSHRPDPPLPTSIEPVSNFFKETP